MHAHIVPTALLSLCLVACGGGGSDTDGEAGVVGDGIRPVVTSAEYACFEDVNGGQFFYFRLEGDDEQGANTIRFDGANVLFTRGGDPLDWDGDGQGDPDDYLPLNCEAETDPRRCEGSLLQSDITGACAETSLTFEGWLVDEDGNESDRVTDFERNPSIAPAG